MKRSCLFISAMIVIQITFGQINSSYKWTWVSGSNGYNATGVYGQKGVESSTNQPGGRYDFASWKDYNGNLWIFGGYGRAASSAPGWMNDLWRFNPVNNRWTWMAGTSVINSPAFQSGPGIESPDNTPSARSAITYWESGDGKELYLYGGATNINGGPDEVLGDVWAFNVVSGMWRIVKYASVDSVGNCTGQNYISPNCNAGIGNDAFTPGVWPVCRQAATASSAGNTAFIFGGQVGSYQNGEFFKFSDYNYGSGSGFCPTRNEWASIQFGAPYINNNAGYFSGNSPRPGSRRDASSFAVAGLSTAQNQFYLFGGSGFGGFVNGVSNIGSLNDLWRYDGKHPLTGNPLWTWLNGDSTINGTGSYGIRGVASASNNPPARRRSIMKNVNNNQAILFGGAGNTSNGFGVLNDVWSYEVNSNMWTWIGGTSIPGDGGNYGFKGTQSNINRIPAREGPAMWVLNDNIYIFGGCCDLKNDMWKFSPQEEPDPTNDEACGAIELVLDAPAQYGNTAFATTTNDIAGNCYGATNTVWYKYTPTTSGFIQFTLGGGLNGDTLNSWIGLFVSSAGNCPSLSLADSTANTLGGCRFYYPNGGNKNATVWSSFLTAGKTYYLRISGINGDIGRYSFSIQSTNITNIVSGNWNDPAIWSNKKVPTSQSNVLINFPVTVTANAICKSLTILNNAQVTIQSNVNLIVLKQ